MALDHFKILYLTTAVGIALNSFHFFLCIIQSSYIIIIKKYFYINRNYCDFLIWNYCYVFLSLFGGSIAGQLRMIMMKKSRS